MFNFNSTKLIVENMTTQLTEKLQKRCIQSDGMPI